MSSAPQDKTLDPDNWDEMSTLAHSMVTDTLEYLRTIRDQPVWRSPPDELLRIITAEEPPMSGQGAAAAYQEYLSKIRPYQLGNAHPRFWAWYLGNGTVMGALAEFLAAAGNSSVAGGNHIAVHIERTVLQWCKTIFGFPEDASGLLLSGASMGNVIALAVARNACAGGDVRAHGVRDLSRPLAFYASSEVHMSIRRALELLGLGGESLRRVPVTASFEMDLDALRDMVRNDREMGIQPCCVIGTAGTTNTGAIDDLASLAEICKDEKLWFHVDGAIGAILALSQTHKDLVRGMDRADSMAFDLHKWMHVPFGAGCVLVRNQSQHRSVFATEPHYLDHHSRGIAGGDFWLSDYGPELSRPFRALKVWLSFKEHGLGKYSELIDQNILMAREFIRVAKETDSIEVDIPSPINIVCFRYHSKEVPEHKLNDLNEELLMRLHEGGIVAPSYTTLYGRYYLRVAFTNHRSVQNDILVLVTEVQRIGRALENSMR